MMPDLAQEAEGRLWIGRPRVGIAEAVVEDGGTEQ